MGACYLPPPDIDDLVRFPSPLAMQNTLQRAPLENVVVVYLPPDINGLVRSRSPLAMQTKNLQHSSVHRSGMWLFSICRRISMTLFDCELKPVGHAEILTA
jgi:hypothetical protein